MKRQNYTKRNFRYQITHSCFFCKILQLDNFEGGDIKYDNTFSKL